MAISKMGQNDLNVKSSCAALKKVFQEQEIDRIARKTGFLRRKRDVTPLAIIVACLSTIGASTANWLADIQRTFNAFAKKNVRYKPFHKQLAKLGFPIFMHAIFESALNYLTLSVLEPIPQGKLALFKDIALHDGSSFALKDSLAGAWPGRFKKISPAAVELHVTMSVFEDNPQVVTLAPDKEAERQFAPLPEEVANKLLIEDRGYQDRDFFRAMVESNGSFIVRGTKNIRPTILRAYADGRRVRKLEGKKLSWSRLPKDMTIDMDMEWGQGSQLYRGRLIAIYKRGKRNRKEFVYLHTNLDRSLFSEVEVGVLYRLRWQVELLFKEWKSHANLHRFDTSKEPIAEGLIWASLLAAILKRSIAHSAGLAVGIEISTQRVAACARHFLDDILTRILRGGRGLMLAVRRAFAYLAQNARRAHPKRDRQKGRFQAGLRQILSY